LPNIIFGFDENWELQNWYDTCTKEATYGLSSGNKWGLGNIPPDVPKIIAKAKSTEDALNKAKIILVEFLKTSEASHQIQETSERAQKRWNKIASEYFLRLSKMLDVPIKDFEKKYYAFFTFSRRCPFSKGKFMFNQFNDFSNNAAHEIMHIEFLKKYEQYCLKGGLSELQVSHLKEILTALLNEDMGDLLYHPDYGYEKHRKIRPRILELYREHKKSDKSFTIFLDKTIDIVKNLRFE